jgi:rubredoxin
MSIVRCENCERLYNTDHWMECPVCMLPYEEEESDD